MGVRWALWIERCRRGGLTWLRGEGDPPLPTTGTGETVETAALVGRRQDTGTAATQEYAVVKDGRDQVMKTQSTLSSKYFKKGRSKELKYIK